MSHVVDRANEFIFNCIALSTRSTYQAAMNSYVAAFQLHGVDAPFPATQTSLCLWMTYSATRTQSRPLAPSTLRTYLSSLSSLHEEMGYPNLLDHKPLVNRCYKGIKKTIGVKSKLLRRPITTAILAQMKTKLNSSFACTMFYAAATLATYALLRMGEFTVTTGKAQPNAFKLLTLAQLALKTDQGQLVSLSSPSLWSSVTHMSLTLRTSKTDPFRQSVTIHIGHVIPVQAMLSYLRVHPCLHTSSSPLFVQSETNHAPLTRDIMIHVTRLLLHMLGYNESEFHGHSFRKGGATSLANAGVAESVIQLVGRWLSDCYKLYVVTPVETLLNASRAM
jgi:hypothetical protein